MQIFKVGYVLDTFTNEEIKKYHTLIDYIYNAREISAYSLREFEDEVMTSETLAEEEHCNGYTVKDRENLKERIGADVYDMLLNKEVDFIILYK